MSLPIPNLDDRTFSQIAEDGRSLIAGTTPEWTDHNVHDPGITFLELFAWLAEIEHYRLNRTSAASYLRYFSLIGLKPHAQEAARVTVETVFDKLAKGKFVPANSVLTAIGNESVPFQTLRDTYLTPAELKEIVTQAGGRVISQTKAEVNLAGHYDLFGPDPRSGDYLELGFKDWFEEEQGQLAITLYENDLPDRPAFATKARGFVPSAKIRWEYLAAGKWQELNIIEDGTLNFSRSGDLIFGKTDKQPAPRKLNGGREELYWIRAVLEEGHFEIPPRIFSIVPNTIHARQVETIVNEDLKTGLGTPDQQVQLNKFPVLIDPQVDDGPFQVGEVLDWRVLTLRLAGPFDSQDSYQKAVGYIAESLKALGAVIDPDKLGDDDKYRLAQVFDRLLDDEGFYRQEQMGVVSTDKGFTDLKTKAESRCREREHIRRFNRFLLQRIFPDLLMSDRIEIETDSPTACAGGRVNQWLSWERVENFLQSGPDDRHYTFNPRTGVVLFGNGLNGRIPQATESIRARFYRVTRGEQGNLAAHKLWQLGVTVELSDEEKSRPRVWTNPAPATGGRESESIEDAKLRSRGIFRKQAPVLTAKDYETAAIQTPGLRVARAKAVPNYNPRLPKLNLPGELTIIVAPQPAPQQAFPESPPPMPSDGFLKTVFNHLETLRLVATNIHVVGPKYVPVTVSCRVFLKKGASSAEANKIIRKALESYLDPTRGGPDRDSGWPFGRSVFPSEITQQLARIPAVDYVTGVSLNGLKVGQKLKLPYNGLPTAGENQVQLISFEDRGTAAKGEKGGKVCE